MCCEAIIKSVAIVVMVVRISRNWRHVRGATAALATHFCLTVVVHDATRSARANVATGDEGDRRKVRLHALVAAGALCRLTPLDTDINSLRYIICVCVFASSFN